MAEYGGTQFVITICVLTGIYTLILSPLSIYYLYMLWTLSLHNIPFFTKRHPKLIIVSAILFNIYPTILRPFADLTRAYSIFPINHPLPRSIVNIMQWYVLLEYIRLWLLYFDYNHSYHSLKLKWQEHILQSEANIPWTHKYKWIGSLKTLSIISISFGFIFVLIIVGGEIIFGSQILILMQMVPMICTFLMLIIAFKVRKCRDEFMIQKEFRIYGISLLLMIILYITIQLISVTGTNLRFILMNIFTCSCCYIMSFVSTHWVIKQYKKQNVNVELLHQQSIEEAQNTINIRLSLEDILSTKDRFDSFANHLVKEFSIENLFYIFEMVQIKNELIVHKLIEEKDVGIMMPIDFYRVRTLRRKDSYIYTIDEMKKNIEYIMTQYIDFSAPYSVNISSYMRNKLQNNYRKLNNSVYNIVELQQIETEMKINKDRNDNELIKRYLQIFDESMEEIITLMKSDSLMRFYASPQYEIMIH